MANEAVLIFETSVPIPMTVPNINGIEKGTVLALLDPFTISGSVSLRSTVAGIAAAEKIASDGITKIPVYREGIFKMFLSGSCTAGDPVSIVNGSPNFVRSSISDADINLSGSRILGIALETGATGESILVELRP